MEDGEGSGEGSTGKRRRALNVPKMEAPTKSERKELLAGRGEDGGCETVQVEDGGEGLEERAGYGGRETA